MSKLEWGSKRVCPSCSTRFYDLHKRPIACPKCASTYDPEIFLKSKKGRLSADEKRGHGNVHAHENEDAEFLIEEAVLEDVALDENELIEDTSELDTVGDDVIDVIEGSDSKPDEE
ncbi:MAG: TIGR02300 family protein [Proteobacteria bacterium]|nr:TIGR02300 family protein [Pseudomonadota bacterium]